MVPQGEEADALHHVQAVRISCDGERKAGAPEMSQYNILAGHDIFNKGHISEISKLVDLPMVMCKVWPSALSPDNPTQPIRKGHYRNAQADWLMVEMDPNFVQTSEVDQYSAWPFRFAKRWEANLGSILVARVDRKLLFPHHLKVLLRFIRQINEMLDFRIPQYESGTPVTTMFVARMLVAAKQPLCGSDVLAPITPREFKDFYMAQCALSQKLLRPTPWHWSMQKLSTSRREVTLREYAGLSLEDKFRNADSSKERLLLTEIHELRCRLEESKEEFERESEEMDWAQAPKTIEQAQGGSRKRRRSQASIDKGGDEYLDASRKRMRT